MLGCFSCWHPLVSMSLWTLTLRRLIVLVYSCLLHGEFWEGRGCLLCFGPTPPSHSFSPSAVASWSTKVGLSPISQQGRNFTRNEQRSRSHRTPRHRDGSHLPLTLYCIKITMPGITCSASSLCLLVLFFTWPFTAVLGGEISCPFLSFHSGQKWKTYDDTELVFSYLIWNIDEPTSSQFCIEI